jgi:hypothetical protein
MCKRCASDEGKAKNLSRSRKYAVIRDRQARGSLVGVI